MSSRCLYLCFCFFCAVAMVAGRPACAQTLSIGGTYNTLTISLTAAGSQTTYTFSAGAGNVTPSYVNGVQIPALYCLDVEHNINVPATYNATITDDGDVYEGSYTGSGSENYGAIALQASVLQGNTSSGPVELHFTNAGQIAYLMDKYASTASTADQETALQAAIWSEVYGSQFAFDAADNTAQNWYNTYLTNVGNSPASGLLWISPTDGSGDHLQALIASPASSFDPPVPEPGPITMFASAGFVGIAMLARRRRPANSIQ